MANIIESGVTLEDEVFEETIDTMEEPIEVVRPSSYNDLEDLPQVNGVTLMGNKTSEELGIVTTTDIENAVSAEATLRENADTALGGRIDGEKTARENADTALGGRIDGEITNRTNEDNALGTRIDNEILARQGGDNNLQTQIDAITSKSDVVDVVADYAALQAYDTQHLGDNDVIKVLDDETHDDAQTYYRWNKTAGTWSYIGSEAPYYSKGQIDQQMQAKQDKLTAGTGITLDGSTISADTTVLATKEDLEPEIVANLPAVGDTTKLYLTPTNKTASGNPITIDLKEDVGQMTSFRLDGDTFQQTYTGKNLFDIATASDVWIKDTGISQPNEVWKNSDFIKVEPNTTYTLSGSTIEGGFKQFQYHEYSSNNESSYINQYAQINLVNSITFTTHTGCNFIRVGYRKDALKDIQLEAGSTATSFEPYVGGVPSPSPDYPQAIQTVTGEQTISINGTDYPLDLGTIELCKLGTYQDYIWKDREDWKVHKEIGHDKKIVSLAGIDGYSSVYGAATTSNGAFSIISTNWGSDYDTTAGLAIASSVIGVYQSQNIDSNNTANSMTDGTFCQRSGTNDRVYFRFASWARSKTVNEVNQMITDNGGLDLWYPLTTPTDTTITDSTLIAQLEAVRKATLANGQNTITNVATGANLAGSMSIGYYGYNPSEYSEWLYVDGAWEQVSGRPMPTKTSDLDNDSEFVTREEIAPKLQTEVVSELPTVGDEGKLYLTPKNYTRGTGTGNPIEATITDEAGKMESFKLDGDTSQQTYTGKNLLMNKESAQEKTGITITPNSDGSFTLNGTATTTTDFYFVGAWNNRTISYLDMTSGDYTASLLDSNKQHVSSPKFRFEIYDRMGENSTRILWFYGVSSPATFTLESSAQVTAYYISIPNGTSFNNEKFYIQLEKGSTATSFEKYVGGVPSPNPDYPQQIQTVTGEQTVTVVGKNLFDGEFEVGNISQNNGSNATQSNMIRSKNYAIVTPETEYTISADGINTVALRFYRSDGVYIGTETSGASPNTFTTPKDTGRVRFVLTGTEDTTKKAQMELGSSASTWEAYRTPTIYPINLGKNKFNGVTTPQVISAAGDISDNGTWALSQNIPVMPGTKYTVSWKLAGSDVSVLITEWKKDGTFIIRHGRQASTSYTFTTTDETAYIRLNYNASYGNSDYMLEAGNTATTYAPYFTPIELCKLGTYQDYIWKDGEDWKVHKATSDTTLDQMAWTNETASGSYGRRYRSTTLVGQIYQISSNTDIAKMDCSHYTVGNMTDTWSGGGQTIALHTNKSVYIYDSRFKDEQTTTALEGWLSSAKPSLYYPLATPTDTTITNQALIAQLEAVRTASLENGTNTITNSTPAPNLTGDMEVGYYGYNPTNRYDKWLWLDLNNNYEQIGS